MLHTDLDNIYTLVNVTAFIVLIGLATYFVLESTQAIAPAQQEKHRDLLAAILTAFIATLLIAMAVILLDPSLLGVPEPPHWFDHNWIKTLHQ